MISTHIEPKTHPAAELPRPKRRCKVQIVSDVALEADARMPAFSQRKPRMKRTGHPHEQIWLRAVNGNSATRLKLPSAPTLDEMMCRFTRASLSPARFAFLRNYPQRMERLHAQALEIFYRYQPSVSITLRRVARFAVVFLGLTALRAHESAKPWL